MTDDEPGREPSAALLTAVGRGAVATIRVRGRIEFLDAACRLFFRAANGRQLATQKVGRICYGFWGSDVTEDLVLCRTDESTIEIQCHGGVSAPRRILDDLASVGIPTLKWQSQTTQHATLLELECLEAVTQAKTSRTSGWLVVQQDRLPRAIHQIAVDAAQITPSSDASAWHAVVEQLGNLLLWSEFGVHLVEPWQVAIVGRPNVGKSTLLNALLGYRRAIVFDEPGTTRDLVTGETAFSGWPILLADTAGLRETSDELENAGISRAKQALAAANCRYFVFDLSQPITSDDLDLIALASTQPRSLLIGNKTDLPSCWQTDLVAADAANWVFVSASSGRGLEELIARTVELLVPQLPAVAAAIPVTRRQIELLEAARSACESRSVPQLNAALESLLL